MESYWQLVGVILWDIKVSSLGPLQMVCMTPNTINGVELSVKYLKEVQNRGFDLSLRIIFMNLELVSSSCNKPIWKLGEMFEIFSFHLSS